MIAEASDAYYKVRDLPPYEQLEIVDRILNDLKPIDPDIEKAWQEEARSRIEAIRKGEMGTKSLLDVISKY